MESKVCPDCDVSMESVGYMDSMGSQPLELKTENDGVLSSFGIGGGTDLEAVVCPECRLVRFYAPDKE